RERHVLAQLESQAEAVTEPVVDSAAGMPRAAGATNHHGCDPCIDEGHHGIAEPSIRPAERQQADPVVEAIGKQTDVAQLRAGADAAAMDDVDAAAGVQN